MLYINLDLNMKKALSPASLKGLAEDANPGVKSLLEPLPL